MTSDSLLEPLLTRIREAEEEYAEPSESEAPPPPDIEKLCSQISRALNTWARLKPTPSTIVHVNITFRTVFDDPPQGTYWKAVAEATLIQPKELPLIPMEGKVGVWPLDYAAAGQALSELTDTPLKQLAFEGPSRTKIAAALAALYARIQKEMAQEMEKFESEYRATGVAYKQLLNFLGPDGAPKVEESSTTPEPPPNASPIPSRRSPRIANLDLGPGQPLEAPVGMKRWHFVTVAYPYRIEVWEEVDLGPTAVDFRGTIFCEVTGKDLFHYYAAKVGDREEPLASLEKVVTAWLDEEALKVKGLAHWLNRSQDKEPHSTSSTKVP